MGGGVGDCSSAIESPFRMGECFALDLYKLRIKVGDVQQADQRRRRTLLSQLPKVGVEERRPAIGSEGKRLWARDCHGAARTLRAD